MTFLTQAKPASFLSFHSALAFLMCGKETAEKGVKSAKAAIAFSVGLPTVLPGRFYL